MPSAASAYTSRLSPSQGDPAQIATAWPLYVTHPPTHPLYIVVWQCMGIETVLPAVSTSSYFNCLVIRWPWPCGDECMNYKASLGWLTEATALDRVASTAASVLAAHITARDGRPNLYIQGMN